MESERTKINNKEKQYAAGNWGSDRFTKKHTKIANPLISEQRKRSLRRKKRVKKPYVLPWSICPFCGGELKKSTKDVSSVLTQYAKRCHRCGARETPQCPACKKKTWLDRAGTYRHRWLGCGFTGKKR